QSRGCIRYRPVRHRARYAVDAPAREIADRGRGLACSSYCNWAWGCGLRLPGLELDQASSRTAADVLIATVLQLSPQPGPRHEVSEALRGGLPVVSRASRTCCSYDPPCGSCRGDPARCSMADLDPWFGLSRRPASARSCCRSAWTPADFGL